jgi:hypothetical protein
MFQNAIEYGTQIAQHVHICRPFNKWRYQVRGNHDKTTARQLWKVEQVYIKSPQWTQYFA